MPYQHKETLTEKKKRFAHEYLIDHNATQAAIRAGYTRYSARSKASQILKEPAVVAYLAEITTKQRMDLTVSANRVLEELARIAFHDVGSFYKLNSKGSEVLKTLSELTEDQRASICEFDSTAKKLKLYDKLPALDKLGKHLKLFTELHEQQHNFTIMPTIKRGGKDIIFNVGSPVKGK